MPRLSKEAIRDSIAALQFGDVDAALAVRDQFNGGASALSDSIRQTIGFIITRTPRLLQDCPPSILEPLRLGAALMELWGEGRIDLFIRIDGPIDYRLPAMAVAHLLHGHGSFLGRIEGMKSAGIKKVQILGSGRQDDCSACKEVDQAIFPINEVPELPLSNCTCEEWCKLVAIAVE